MYWEHGIRPRDQADNERMCPYSNKGFGGRRLFDPCRAVVDSAKGLNQKRKRVKCPVCGRRMWAWATIDHDGEIVYYAIPRHKRKGWWRKGKKVSRGTKARMRPR